MDLSAAIRDVRETMESIATDVAALRATIHESDAARRAELESALAKVADEERLELALERRKNLCALLRGYTLLRRPVSGVERSQSFTLAIDALIRSHIAPRQNDGKSDDSKGDDEGLRHALTTLAPLDNSLESGVDDSLNPMMWTVLFVYGAAFVTDLQRIGVGSGESAVTPATLDELVEAPEQLRWDPTEESHRMAAEGLLSRCAPLPVRVLWYLAENILAPALAHRQANPSIARALFDALAGAVGVGVTNAILQEAPALRGLLQR